MSENIEKIPENAVKLNFAWYEFMGICRPEYELRKKFDDMRRPAPNETQEETDLRIHRSDFQERKLKWDFLAEIRNDNFAVFGRDVTNQIDSPIIKVPNFLFEEAAPDFEIEWEYNRITVHNRKIVDIHVMPTIQSAPGTLVAEDRDASKLPAENTTADRYPSKAGAKSYAHIREAAIIECYRQYPDFGSWKFSKRLKEAQDTARKQNPWFDASASFGRSSYYSAINSLVKSKRLPSNNVQ